MPIAKYKREKRDGKDLYYTYEKTGLYLPNGKVEYKKLRSATIAGLDRKVREYRENAAFGVEPTSITVDEWYIRYFESYKSGCRPSTKNFYESLYNNHIKEKIGKMRLSQVREFNCQKILNDMSADYSIKTVTSVRTLLFSLFDKAVKNKLIVVSPASSLTTAGNPVKNCRALTLEERKKYLKTAETHPFGDFALFLYFFGLRRGEALALTRDDIGKNELTINKQFTYADNNQPALSPPKTAAGVRKVPIPDKLRKMLDLDSYAPGLLFVDDEGGALSYSQVTDRWNSFIHTALGDDTEITMHYIRHNFCTMLFEKQVDLLTAKELMGHEDVETTLKIYTHYTESLKKKSENKILKIG